MDIILIGLGGLSFLLLVALIITIKKNMFYTKKYSNLINIGEYYMFQPLGLGNKHSSRYARSSIAPNFSQKILIQIPKQKSRISQRGTASGGRRTR